MFFEMDKCPWYCGCMKHLSNSKLIALFSFTILTEVISVPIDNALLGSVNQECLVGRSVDLGFILDGSGSIGDQTFDKQKTFVNFMIDTLDISQNKTRIGIMQFSDWPQTELSFSHIASNRTLKRIVEGITFMSGATYTGKALTFANEKLFKDARGVTIPQVAIVITDGQSQDAVATAAQSLRSIGVLIYAIGVTDKIDLNELILITGSAKRVFTVSSFEQLNKQLVKSITDEMCKTDFRPGYPEIICGSREIGVRARTRNDFQGNVFIKNHFHNPRCRRGPETFLSTPKSIGISVAFTECDINRYRSLNPRGVYVETTVIFMFHPFFMTKVDQAIKIQCFFMEAEKTVDTPLEVSTLSTEFRSEVYPMPSCVYSLHRGAPDGPLVRFAVVGESVYHRWECFEHNENYDAYGMLVHNCFVDDSQGDMVYLLDKHGCGIDVHLLGTPEYSDNLKVAFRESHIFKYADRPFLQFQCQITLCYKHDGGCNGLTPPKCRKSFRSRLTRKSEAYDPQNTLDVIAEPITVLDVDADGSNLEDFWNMAKGSDIDSSLEESCFGHLTVILVGGIVGFLYFVIIVTVGMYFRRKSERK